jgi:ligand-binding sensor domain-containing protein
MGTPSGLARFDGIRFEVFTHLSTPALKNDRILTLFEDATDVLWVGTDGGGLVSRRKGDWKNYTRADGLSNDHVKAIVGDWEGNLWVGTEYGLNRIGLDGFRVVTTEDGLYDNIITALAVDPFGVLWIGTLRGGVARY